MQIVYQMSKKVHQFTRINAEGIFLFFNMLIWFLIGLIVGDVLGYYFATSKADNIQYILSVSSIFSVILGFIRAGFWLVVNSEEKK